MPLVADTARSFTMALITATCIIAGLALGRDILMPLALAALLAFILIPMVKWLGAHNVPHGIAVAGVMISLVIFLISASGVFSAQMLSLTADLGTYKANLITKVRSISAGRTSEGTLKRAIDSVDSLETEIKREWSHTGGPAASPTVVVARESDGGTIWTNVHLIGAPLAQAALTLLFTTFLLLQHSDLRDRVIRIVGTDNLSEATAAMIDAGEKLSQLFLTQAVLNVGFGAFITVALWAIGVPNPLLWGFLTSVMRFVPFVGALLSAIPPLLTAASVDPG